MVAARVVVSGDVQGVFFRDSCHRRALESGVTGWVRNASDGTVEALFEGEEDSVEAMIRWCRSGPSEAQVTDVEVFDEEESGLDGFEVR